MCTAFGYRLRNIGGKEKYRFTARLYVLCILNSFLVCILESTASCIHWEGQGGTCLFCLTQNWNNHSYRVRFMCLLLNWLLWNLFLLSKLIYLKRKYKGNFIVFLLLTSHQALFLSLKGKCGMWTIILFLLGKSFPLLEILILEKK